MKKDLGAATAYAIALKNGFVGTEKQWLESLNGKPGYTPVKGIDYRDGIDGVTPVKGVDYRDGVTPVKGVDYNDGVGIAEVVYNDDNTMTIIMTDGRVYTSPILKGEDGHTPVITAAKVGKITTIYADGRAIAEISDGADGDVDLDSTVHSGAPLAGIYTSKRYLKPDGSIYKTGYDEWRLYRYDVSGYGNTTLNVTTYKPVFNVSKVALVSFTSVAVDNISSNTVTADTIIGSPTVYEKETDGIITEQHEVPEGAKTLLVTVYRDYIDQYPIVVPKHFGAFKWDFDKKQDALTAGENIVIEGNTISATMSDVSSKLDKPEDAPAVGRVLRIKSVNEDGSFVCEWADTAGGVNDVQINGTSIMRDGVAELIVTAGYGIGFNKTTGLYVNPIVQGNIDARSAYRAITAGMLNPALIAGLTDAKHIILTEEQQRTAQEVLGIGGESAEAWHFVEKITITEDTTLLTRSAEPDGTPYNFKQILLILKNSEALSAGGVPRLDVRTRRATGVLFRYNTFLAPVKMQWCMVDVSNDMFVHWRHFGNNYGEYGAVTLMEHYAVRSNPSDMGCPICEIQIITGTNGVPLRNGATIEIYAQNA